MVRLVVPVSGYVVHTLSVPPAKLGEEERAIVQPGPPQDMESVSTQSVVIEVEMVELLVELPVAVVVRVNEVPPLGLLMVTAELTGKLLYKAVAIAAAVDGEEPP